MIELIRETIEAKEYQKAQALIEEFQKQEPENPWLEYEQAYLAEVQDNLEVANQIYIQILRQSNHHKVITQARQGIRRIQTRQQQENQQQKQQKKEELQQALAKPEGQELGALILKPLSLEAKKNIAVQFAQLMEIETYNAMMILPTRFWRLYRTGMRGELDYYVSELEKLNIGTFAVSLTEIKSIEVYQLDYFQSHNSEITIIYHQQESEVKSLTFNWLEVKTIVEGMLPILTITWDKDPWGKSQPKFTTSDYIHFCDLHLTKQNMILRLSEQSYKFGQGISDIFNFKEQTTHKHWQQLIHWVKQQIPHSPIYSDFTNFGQIALDFPDFLAHIEPKIYLFRQQQTLWDNAFELYSRLVFLKT